MELTGFSINKSVLLICIAAICVTNFIFMPYLSLVAFCGVIALYILASERNENYFACFLFFLGILLVTLVPTALKTLDPLMNDKVNYRFEMVLGQGQSITQWIEDFSGPDFLSHFLIFLSSYVFGVNDLAFACYLFICFSIMSIGLYRLAGKGFVIILFLFCSQFTFQGLYGNLLRQCLALSLLLLALSYVSNWKRILILVLSALSHFSFLAYIPFVFVKKIIDKFTTIVAISSYIVCYLVGKFLFAIIISVLPTGGLFSDKASQYDGATFDGNDFARKLAVTVIFIILIESAYLFKRAFLVFDENKEKKLTTLRSFFIYGCLLFFLCTTFVEVSNRYAFNLMIFVFAYILMLVEGIGDYILRMAVYLLLIILGFGFFVYINIISNQFLYSGDLVSILSDGILSVLYKVGLF